MATWDLDHIEILTSRFDFIAFESWKRSIGYSLRIEGLWGHIKDTSKLNGIFPVCAQPPAPTAEASAEELDEYHAWWVNDAKVKTALFRRMNKNVIEKIPFGVDYTAMMVWEGLDVIFGFARRRRGSGSKIMRKNAWEMKTHLEIERHRRDILILEKY